MSTTVIRKTVRLNGLLTDVYSVKLSNEAGTFGVRRSDTGAVVVSDGVSLERLGVGVYAYSFQDPAAGLSYEYWLEITRSLGDTPDYVEGSIAGGGVSTGNLYDLKPLVMPYLPGCPEPVVEQQLRWAARIFAQQTGLRREQIEIAAVVDQVEYALASTEDAEIDAVAYVYSGPDPATEPLEDWGLVAAHRYDRATGKLVLRSAPQETGQVLAVGLVLLPRITDTTWPAWILNKWGPAIADGALFFCYAMPKTPWGDPQAAQTRAQAWYSALGDAKIDQATEGLFGPVTVAIPSFH